MKNKSSALKILGERLKNIDQETLEPLAREEYVSAFFDNSIKNNKFTFDGVEELPGWFLIYALESVWERIEKGQRSFLLNILNSKLESASYRDLKIELAAKLALCDPSSGVDMLTAVGNKQPKKDGVFPKIYIDTVLKHFFLNELKPIRAILNYQFDLTYKINKVFLLFFEILFEGKGSYEGEDKHLLQSELLEWIIKYDAFEYCNRKYPGAIINSVSRWPMSMVSILSELRNKVQESALQWDLVIDDTLTPISPSGDMKNEANVETLSQFSSIQLLEQLGVNVSEANSTIQNQQTEIVRLRNERAEAQAECKKQEEAFCEKCKVLRLEIKDYELNLEEKKKKVQWIEKEVRRQQFKVEGLNKEVCSLQEKIDVMASEHSTELQKAVGRINVEVEHTSNEFRTKLKELLRPEFNDMKRLGSSNDEEIAKIMLERLFNKLKRLNVSFS